MKIIATNKRASYDYEISLKLDAGLVLTGSEVKSLRNDMKLKDKEIGRMMKKINKLESKLK